jgi:hypothetical protein
VAGAWRHAVGPHLARTLGVTRHTLPTLSLTAGGHMQQNTETSWRATAASAMEAAKRGDWRSCQELCALTSERQSPALMTVSRLNILICQYQLGSTDLIPERALPLIMHLTTGATIASLGLALLAARKSGTLLEFKPVVLALADERHRALDLPTVPTFVLLHENEVGCTVLEHADASLMSEVVGSFLSSDLLDSEEKPKLESLARRYRERAAITAASHLRPEAPSAKKQAWWRRC